jgi:hypothetical protein
MGFACAVITARLALSFMLCSSGLGIALICTAFKRA